MRQTCHLSVSFKKFFRRKALCLLSVHPLQATLADRGRGCVLPFPLSNIPDSKFSGRVPSGIPALLAADRVFRLNSAARRTGISKGKSVSLLVWRSEPPFSRKCTGAAPPHITAPPHATAADNRRPLQAFCYCLFNSTSIVIPNPAGMRVRNLNAPSSRGFGVSLSVPPLSSPLRRAGVCVLSVPPFKNPPLLHSL